MPQELSGTVTNDGNIIFETIQKRDRNTDSSFCKAVNEPAKIRSDRQQSVEGFAEEGHFAEALVKSYNELQGTSYRIEDKKKEDGKYEDRVFVSDVDEPRRITVQIRHLDPKLIAQIGTTGSARVTRTPSCIAALIQEAIKAKSLVDPKKKAETILQLILPSPLGQATPDAIRGTTFDFHGFKDVWISPFRESSFPLSPPQDDDVDTV